MDAEKDPAAVIAEVQKLVSRTRTACLWFTREDYVPQDAAQAISCLDKILRHGDRETYMQARRLKEWLLRNSSVKSSR